MPSKSRNDDIEIPAKAETKSSQHLVSELQKQLEQCETAIGDLQTALDKVTDLCERARLLEKMSATISKLDEISGELYHHQLPASEWVRFGEILYTLDAEKDAQSFFERALAADPAHVDALNNLGVLHYKRGEYTAAKTRFLEALEIDSRCREPQDNLRCLYADYPTLISEPRTEETSRNDSVLSGSSKIHERGEVSPISEIKPHPETNISTQNFADFMEGLQGGITTEEADLLRRLASAVPRGCIVEVGFYRGKSAVAMALGVRDQGGAQNPTVYCIEPHRSFTGFYGGEFGPADRKTFFETMCRTEAFKEVALINLSSERVAPNWDQPIGLLFIDGDHRYPAVKQDFENWEVHVVVGGIIAFDDAKDPDCGPFRLINEILETGRYVRLEEVGKIVVLKKLHEASCFDRPLPKSLQRILVACHHVVPTGGIFRFERLGKVLKSWGHEVVFVALAGAPLKQGKWTIPVLTLEEASAMTWDAVMVPGAGFPEETIRKLSVFRNSSFGVRIQHILNDQSRRAAFKSVNTSFAPNVVIFNNLAWPVGSFTDFQADRFHFLLGAVDVGDFRPATYRSHPLYKTKWVIGGLVNKNPEPLIAALSDLPADVVVRLYGYDLLDIASKYRALIVDGRLELIGPLQGDELGRFYRSVDCIAMTETSAGWANLVAEAMASGVPVVCTPNGTTAFARNEDTALVIDEPTPAALVESVLRLRRDSDLCYRLTDRGRKVIENYSWDRYARQLLRLIPHDGHQHYVHAPDLGLYGKWPLEERLSGLQSLLTRAAGLSVIDFGAAEGVIAREFLKHDAAKLHGFELNADRVNVAKALCSVWGDAEFRAADLSDWEAFQAAHADLIEESYDIVLYLGIQHHLPSGARLVTLQNALRLARRYFAIRTSEHIYEVDGIDVLLRSEGFQLLEEETSSDCCAQLGPLRIYERTNSVNVRTRPHSAPRQLTSRQRQFVSYPKSGRTWIRYMLTQLGVGEQIIFHHDCFEFNSGTCPPHDFDLKWRLEKYAQVEKLVYLERDPRDVMVSLYFQVTGRFRDFFGYRGSISDFIRDDYFGASNLKEFRAMWDEITSRLGFLTVSYEECHKDVKNLIRKVLSYYELEVDEARIVESVADASFDNMLSTGQKTSIAIENPSID
ncbi:MAG: class I SAM-dependent methyltransferase, partial [Methylohalobius sp. ZOD2]